MERNVRTEQCPECGGVTFIRDSEAGERVCDRCGFVVSSTLVDKGPEWRAFNAEQRKRRTRVGAPLTTLIHDRGLSTVIGRHNRDASGRRLKPDQRAQIYRLRKWNRRSKVKGSTERNLAYALSELTKVSYKLNLPKNALETASVIYRRVVRKHLVRGRSIRSVVAATIYMACRQCNVIRSIEATADAANVTRKDCARSYRVLLRKLEADVPPVDRYKYISKIVNHIELSGGTEDIASKVLDRAAELKLTSGKSPSGVAAACIYIASRLTGELRTQGEIARVAKVTEVTIRNRYKELTHELNLQIDL